MDTSPAHPPVTAAPGPSFRRQPALFVSHGSPMIALEPGTTGAFLRQYGPGLFETDARPRAILAISAHTTLPPQAHRRGLDVAVLAAAHQPTVHDFGGFDPRLNRIRYDTPGDPALAAAIAAGLRSQGWSAQALEAGGLDHGIWTALMYLHPAGDVPVLPMAWPADASPDRLLDLGRALAPWRDQGVMVLATGSITHDLRRVFSGGMASRGAPAESMPEIPESRAFRRWWADRAAAADWAALVDWRRQAPHGVAMHPTDEHLLPWFVAAGAAARTPDAPLPPAQRIHEGVTFGCLGMDAYRFD